MQRVLAAPFTLDNPTSQQTRRLGVLAVLSWLQTHPGNSWQQRWQASGAEDQPDWRDTITAAAAGRRRASTRPQTGLPHLSPGLLVLICADVIRPSLGWLLRAISAASPRRAGGETQQPCSCAAVYSARHRWRSAMACSSSTGRVARRDRPGRSIPRGRAVLVGLGGLDPGVFQELPNELGAFGAVVGRGLVGPLARDQDAASGDAEVFGLVRVALHRGEGVFVVACGDASPLLGS